MSKRQLYLARINPCRRCHTNFQLVCSSIQRAPLSQHAGNNQQPPRALNLCLCKFASLECFPYMPAFLIQRRCAERVCASERRMLSTLRPFQAQFKKTHLEFLQITFALTDTKQNRVSPSLSLNFTRQHYFIGLPFEHIICFFAIKRTMQ